MKGLAGLVSLEASPWLVDDHLLAGSSCDLSSMFAHPWGLFVCPSFPFLQGHQSTWVRTRWNSVILT